MKLKRFVPAALAALLFDPLPASAADFTVTTSPGTANVYTSGNVTFAGHIAELHGTILKGKRGTVLEIDGHGEIFGCTGHVSMSPIVNFLAPNLVAAYIVPTVDAFNASNSNSGVWWLDIDQAEAESPGDFYDKPLDITLQANHISCPDGATFSGTLRARLVKK